MGFVLAVIRRMAGIFMSFRNVLKYSDYDLFVKPFEMRFFVFLLIPFV